MKFVLLLSLLILSSCCKQEESPIVVLKEFDKCFNIDSILYVRIDNTPSGNIVSLIQPVWHNKKIIQMYNKLETFYIDASTLYKKIDNKTAESIDCAKLMYPVLK